MGTTHSLPPVTDAGPPSDTAPPEARASRSRGADESDDVRACYGEAFSAPMSTLTTLGALEEIAVAAYSDPTGRLLGDCHGIMHTVGREYAQATGSRWRT